MIKKGNVRICVTLNESDYKTLLDYMDWLSTISDHDVTKSEAICNLIETHDYMFSD